MRELGNLKTGHDISIPYVSRWYLTSVVNTATLNTL